MHLPVRLRVPLAGLALCSAALLDQRLRRQLRVRRRSTQQDRARPTPSPIVGAETVPRSKLTELMTQVCVQYKAAKKACPKPGSAERKQLQQSFVAQLVTQAEFDEAGKQLKVTVKQSEIDTNLNKLKLQYAKGANGKVDDAKWKKVLEGQPHDAGRGRREPPQRAPAPGHLRQSDEERDRRRRGRPGVLHEEQEDLRDAREPPGPPHPGQGQGHSPTRSTRSSRRATRSSRRSPRSTRSTPARRRPEGSSARSRRGRPSRPSTRSRSALRPVRSPSRSRAPTAGT